MKIEHVYNKELMYETTKKRRDYFLEILEVEGAKRVVVINRLSVDAVNDFKNPEGNYVVLGVANNGVSTITWYKDIKLHREDGPAYQSYSRDNRMGETTTSEYWYEGNRCYNVHSVGVLKLGVEFNGEIILEEEKFGKNILYLKRLNQYGLLVLGYEWSMNK